MMGASNDFYNFVEDAYIVFRKENGTTLNAAWEMYKIYCEEAKVPYPLTRRVFKEELKNYFSEFTDRCKTEDGTRVRNYYSGFITDKFEQQTYVEKPSTTSNLIEFKDIESIFDKECSNCPAQYATDEGTPLKGWDYVDGKLSDIDTSKLHYVRVPENHIVIDFDIPDKNRNKDFNKKLEESKLIASNC
jgi:phage/plasmid-associated DNA primase